MTLFERVKMLAKKRGMTITELERKAGLGANYIYSLKKSDNPRKSSIASIAKVLGVTTDYLEGKNDTPEWANDQDTHDLKEFLENNADSMTYGGDDLTQEEKEKLKIAMTQIFWNRHKHD